MRGCSAGRASRARAPPGCISGHRAGRKPLPSLTEPGWHRSRAAKGGCHAASMREGTSAGPGCVSEARPAPLPATRGSPCRRFYTRPSVKRRALPALRRVGSGPRPRRPSGPWQVFWRKMRSKPEAVWRINRESRRCHCKKQLGWEGDRRARRIARCRDSDARSHENGEPGPRLSRGHGISISSTRTAQDGQQERRRIAVLDGTLSRKPSSLECFLAHRSHWIPEHAHHRMVLAKGAPRPGWLTDRFRCRYRPDGIVGCLPC